MLILKTTNYSQGVRIISLIVIRSLLIMKSFYRFLLVSGIVLCTYSLSATNYYVSSSGNDANEGTSVSLPWKSLAKVNSFKPKPGDQILFKRGDVWNGSITAKDSGTKGSPIVYGAYGTGEKPKIYGSVPITGWTLHLGNIYKATVDETDITQLFLNDERMLLARYPDAGYLNTTSVNNKTTFTSTDLSGSINYTGATWIGRTSLFTMYSKTVTGSRSQTITLNSAPTYGLGVGEGFFLCNKLEFLTQAGEWYYDNAANTLYLWTPNGGSPSGYEVRASTVDYGISINKSYITLQNLEIAQSAETGIHLKNGNYITIDNCNIVSPDMFGVHAPASASANLTVTNTYIYQANSAGIRSYSSSAVLTGNTIEDTGLLENINKRTNASGDNFGTAIFQRERNSIIQYNNILNSGYCGINFYGANTMVKYNFIDGACVTLDDGGGIYTYNKTIPTASSGSKIMYNIIKGVHGTTAGYNSTYGMGHGIYMDDNTANIEVLYNTVFNSHSGYFSHKNSNILFQYNTSFDNLIGLLTVGKNANSYFYDNIVYAASRTGSSTWWTDSFQRMAVQSAASSVYDRNTYIHPYNSTPFRPGATQITSTEWKSNTKQDANSTFNGIALGAGETEMLFYNETKQTKKFNLGNSVYRDIYGKQISGTISLEPFTSKILIKTKSVINPDIEPPIISSFTIPSTATSLTIPIATLSATDNTAVIGYKLTETSTSPSSGDAGWNTVAPTSYTFKSEGTKTIYAWVKDDAGNVSKSVSDQVKITLPVISDKSDITKPTITAFLISSTATSMTIPISSFSATDNIGVIGYKLTETSTAPNAGGNGWNIVAPTSYTFTSEGTKTLFAWVKDAAGNVSASMSNQVVITLPDNSQTFSEYLFEENTGTNVYDSQGSNNGTIINEELRGTGVIGKGLTFTGSGYINLGQCFGENVENEVSLSVWIKPNTLTGKYQGIIMHGGPNTDSYALYIRPDSKEIGFKTSGTTSSWVTVDNVNDLWDGDWHHIVVTYNGSEKVIYLDNVALIKIGATGKIESGAGYNLLIGAGRDGVSPSFLYNGLIDEVRIYNYAITSSQIAELYNLDNQKQVITTPTISLFSIPETSSSLIIPINSFHVTDDFAVTGFMLTETSTAPHADNAEWSEETPEFYTFATEGNKTLYAWVKDVDGNVSASMSDQVIITLTNNLDSKVIAWYDFEETSGNTFVDTKGNHNGTIGPNITIKQDGSHGMAHRFPGTDFGYFSWVPNHPDLTPGNSFAISTWINLSSLSVDATILEKRNEYYLLVSKTGNIELRIFEQGTAFYYGTRTDSDVIKTNTPYFIVVNVIDGINNRFEIIVNGISKPLTQRKNFERSPLGMKNSSNIFTVGGAGGSYLKTVGIISQLILFNDVLTTEEMTNLYNQKTPVLTKSGSISESDTANAAIIESATHGSVAFSDTEGLNKANDLKLYPNPAKSFIKVDYSEMPETGTTIEIIDSNGRTVYKKLIESTSTRIEINQYPAGLYYIRSANQHQNITKKLIITK